VQSNFQRLQAAIDPLVPVFVLIDPMVGEPLPGFGMPDVGSDGKAEREQIWQRDVTPVVLAKTIALPQHQHPYLVQLHGPADPLLELTFTLADQERRTAQANGLEGEGRAAHRIGGWLQSSMGGSNVAQVISRMCKVSTRIPTTATYMRLADRRVLDLLCHVVGTERVTSQLERIQRWTFLDSFGEPRCIEASAAHGVALTLEGGEWTHMERGPKLHQAIARYLGEPERSSNTIPDYAIVDNALISAAHARQQWPSRFQHDDDEIIWAVLSMLYPSFDRVGTIRKFLDGAVPSSDAYEPIRFIFRDVVALFQSSQSSSN